MSQKFDPNAAAQYDGIYGLPYTVEQSKFVVIPAPFDATTSFKPGTCDGPAAILQASRQVELFDPFWWRPYKHGIAMLPMRHREVQKIRRLNNEARPLAKKIIDVGGNIEGKRGLTDALKRVNR